MGEKEFLEIRTRQRAALTWLPLDLGGLMAPLSDMADELDSLGVASIENYMAIGDEAWVIKETQRDQTIEFSQAEVNQDIDIATAKAAATRAKIAIERAADEYALAVKYYDVSVKGILMSARELAGIVEQEQLAAEAEKAAVDVEKEGVRQTQIAVKVQIEAIESAQVDADIAKAQVDVAKAHVRAAIAGVEAGKAEVEAIEAQVQVAMAEAEKATLQADVAMIFADILTHQLTAVKLGAERAEIAAGYSVINSRLTDAIDLYDAKVLIEGIRTEAEVALLAEIAAMQAEQQAAADLRAAEAAVSTALADYEKAVAAGEITTEAALKAALTVAKNALADARKAASESKDNATTVANRLVNNAHIGTYGNLTSTNQSLSQDTEYISGE
jgi:hypothetical protein